MAALLFEAVPDVGGSRMTSVWHSRDANRDRSGDWAMAHFVRLPADQHVDIEGDFLTSHLPFCVGGVGGVFPDGAPWLLVLQQSVVLREDESAMSFAEELGVLDASVRSALRHNPGAEASRGLPWHRNDLLRDYQDAGIDEAIIRKWPTTDLLVGLLANCCGPSLVNLANGYISGCAFPKEDHTCQLDVFEDTFSRWQAGDLRPTDKES